MGSPVALTRMRRIGILHPQQCKSHSPTSGRRCIRNRQHYATEHTSGDPVRWGSAATHRETWKLTDEELRARSRWRRGMVRDPKDGRRFLNRASQRQATENWSGKGHQSWD